MTNKNECRSKLNDVEEKLNLSPACYKVNGVYKIHWGYADEALSGSLWDATPEEEAEYNRRKDACQIIDFLIQVRNALLSELAK